MEHISIMLRPDGFINKNPALDVPSASQTVNKSERHTDKPTDEIAQGFSYCKL
jgi:primary-amine oxidase